MTTPVPGFPNSFQTQYTRMPKAGLPGTYWEGELHTQRPASGLIACVTEVAYAATVTIGAFNAGDEVGININGVQVSVTAVTDAAATAILLNTAINSAAILSGVLSSVIAAPGVLTLAGALGVSIDASEYSPDATTAVFSAVTASVVQQQLLFGMAVVKDVPSATTNFIKVRKPSSADDIFAGVLAYTPGSDIPPDQILAAGFNPNYLMPGQTYCVERANCGLYVEYIGDVPTEVDPVYYVWSGANAGFWQVTDGSTPGTSEVVTLTLTTTAADAVAFNYDGLPDLSIASASGTETTDATNLYNQWISSAAYAAIGSIVDNADGTLTITFFDTTTHTFTDNSGGTSSIAEVVDTAAVASTPATATLVPGYSWGAPSITEDLPTRARLRLANP